MKKGSLKWLIATMLIVTALVITACSRNGDEPTPVTPEPPAQTTTPEPVDEDDNDEVEETPEEPIALSGSFTYWSYTDSAHNLVAAFNAVYPDIHVDVTIFGGGEYRTHMLTTFMSGDLPDLFDLEEGYMYEFLDSPLILDLSTIMDTGVFAREWVPFQNYAMKNGNGVYKALIFQSSPVVMWYLRDVAEEWLGTSDDREISAMIYSWDAMLEVARDVYLASDGEVTVWPNVGSMFVVDALTKPTLVVDNTLTIAPQWFDLINTMRRVWESPYTRHYPAWSGEWAAAWNNGEFLFRAMPSWDFFTDWDRNRGNVGIAVPPSGAFEGNTGISVFANSEHHDLIATFLNYVASDEFQTLNLEQHNQVPANLRLIQDLSNGFSAPDFGGQNILDTYARVLATIPAFTPDRFTRPLINTFQGRASTGIQNDWTDEEIINEFIDMIADQYPELTIVRPDIP
ncbi:MAG: extracellular solute-binding protein [Defluviitaleaceae bacterium]|nr:extracellular solute-binding protein [Defluviitaleaceae bacterium]